MSGPRVEEEEATQHPSEENALSLLTSNAEEAGERRAQGGKDNFKSFLFTSRGPAIPPSQFSPFVFKPWRKSPRQRRVRFRMPRRQHKASDNQEDKADLKPWGNQRKGGKSRRKSPRPETQTPDKPKPIPPGEHGSKSILEALEEERLRLVRENMKLLNELRIKEEVTQGYIRQLDKVRLSLSQSAEESTDIKLTQQNNPRGLLRKRLKEVSCGCIEQDFKTRQLKKMMYREKQLVFTASLRGREMTQKLDQIKGSVLGNLKERLLGLQAEHKSLCSQMKAEKAAALNERVERQRELELGKDQLNNRRLIHKLKVRATEHRNSIKTASYEDLYRDKLQRKLDSQEKKEKITKTLVGGMKCRLSKFEQTMNKIQAETGYKEIVEAMERFFSQSARLGALEQEVADKHQRRSMLEAHLKECTASLNQLESCGYEVTHDVNQIYEQERNIMNATTKLHEKQTSLHRKQEMLYAVVYGLFSLWKSLHIKIPDSIQKVDLSFICDNDNYQTIEHLFEESIERFSKLATITKDTDSGNPFHEPGSISKEVTPLVTNEKNVRVKSRRTTFVPTSSAALLRAPGTIQSHKRKPKSVTSAPTAQEEDELSKMSSDVEISSILRIAAKQVKGSKAEDEKHKELLKVWDRMKALQKQTVITRSQLKLVCNSFANVPPDVTAFDDLNLEDPKKQKQEMKTPEPQRVKVVEARRKGFYVKPARSTG